MLQRALQVLAAGAMQRRDCKLPWLGALILLLSFFQGVASDCVFTYTPVIGDNNDVIAYETYYNGTRTTDCGAWGKELVAIPHGGPCCAWVSNFTLELVSAARRPAVVPVGVCGRDVRRDLSSMLSEYLRRGDVPLRMWGVEPRGVHTMHKQRNEGPALHEVSGSCVPIFFQQEPLHVDEPTSP